MGSLYQRALALRKKIDHDIELLEKNLGGDLEPWITPEERRKIFADLDQAGNGHPTREPSGKLAFTPERNDRFFPLIFNVAVVAATAVGILLLVLFFTGEHRSQTAAEADLVTAEARLFASFRAETQEELSRKDQEILDARRRLEEMNRERERLQEEGEERIAERTAGLQAEMESRLEEERQRLAGQGLDTASIDSRIEELERQLSRQQEEELEAYRRQVEEERAEREAALAALMSEYDRDLGQLQAERERLEGELEQLEAESQARLEREREALEEERTAVQRQLESLQAQNERERLAMDQILSGYSRVAELLRIPDFPAALQQLEVIQSFLSQPSVSSLPAIQRRRPAELFIIRSLRELIEEQRADSDQPTENLIAAAERLTSISRIVEQADAAYRNGNTERAKELYVAAIEVIPALGRSYPVLWSLERSVLEGQISALQGTITTLQGTIAGLESELESRRGDAVAPGAVDPELIGRIEELEAQIAAANRQLTEAESKRQSAEQRLSAYEASDSRVEELEAQIAAANRQLTEAESKRQSAEQRLSAYEALESRIEGVGENFDRIAAETTWEYSENELLALLETKLRLNEVLSSSTVQQEDPDLYQDVETYLRVYGRTFEDEGRAAMLRDVITLLQALDREESTERLLSIVAPYEEQELQQLLQQFFTILSDLLE
jgi:chromosome segregation ATPase